MSRDTTGVEDESWQQLLDETGGLSIVLTPKPGELIPLKQIGTTIVAFAELLDAITEEQGGSLSWVLGSIGFDDDGTIRLNAQATPPDAT